MMNLCCDKNKFFTDLVILARTYGWQGDYVEVGAFIEWIGSRLNINISSEELTPFENVDFPEQGEIRMITNQYFHFFPKETGLPFHIFISNRSLSDKEPHFLAPTQDLIGKVVFKLSDYKVIPLRQPVIIEQSSDLFIQNFKKHNQKQLLAFWNEEVDIAEFVKSIVIDTYLQ